MVSKCNIVPKTIVFLFHCLLFNIVENYRKSKSSYSFRLRLVTYINIIRETFEIYFYQERYVVRSSDNTVRSKNRSPVKVLGIKNACLTPEPQAGAVMCVFCAIYLMVWFLCAVAQDVLSRIHCIMILRKWTIDLLLFLVITSYLIIDRLIIAVFTSCIYL